MSETPSAPVPPPSSPLAFRWPRPFLLATLAAFALSCVVYGLVIVFEPVTDIDAHIDVVHRVMLGEAQMPPNFLYYWLVAALSGFSDSLAVLSWTAVGILAAATAAKAYLTMILLEAMTRTVPARRIAWMALALMVVFPLPALSNLLGLNFYLGQLPANVWHNSTTIFLMPVALALFHLNYRYAFEGASHLFVWVLGLAVVSLLIKPSYFIALLPATALHLAWRYGIGGAALRGNLRRILPLALASVVLVALTVLVFDKQVGLIQEEPSYMTIAPLAAWQPILASDIRVTITPLLMAAMMVSAVVMSFALPLGLWAAGEWPRGDGMVRNATIGLGVAMVIFLVLAETGPRAIHGNFFWQVVVCHYILLVVLAAHVLQRIQDGALSRRLRLVLYLGGAMVCMGLLYLPRLTLQNYS